MTTNPPPAREARAPKPLTQREARFVEQYRLHGNAARAAREAGYSAHHKAIGYALLRKAKIVAALRDAGLSIVLAPKKPGAPKNYARAYKREGLTLLQERFVHQYLIDGNATQAAIRAGLPARNPVRAGSQMLHHRAVAQAIECERAAAAARLSITADRVKSELAAIAFASMADVAEWGPDGLTLKEKTTLSAPDRAAIAELSSARVEKTGAVKAHVKMHSKQAALDALAKHLGLYGRGTRTLARTALTPEEEEREQREANAELRERLLKIAGQKKE